MIETVARCNLCGTVEDVEDGRIVARPGHLCGACKRTLYTIEDGSKDPGLATDKARELADQLLPMWVAMRDVQRQIDAELDRHRTEEERARQVAMRLAREQDEKARKEAETEAREVMRIAEAIAAEQEAELRAATAEAEAKAQSDKERESLERREILDRLASIDGKLRVLTGGGIEKA